MPHGTPPIKCWEVELRSPGATQRPVRIPRFESVIPWVRTHRDEYAARNEG